ncbi:MAG: hypothetical protein KGL04_08810 [Elusimicrobia bacterium]|nr:hypothetical protein [Elusimicrobiota bacterium]MDE2314261.1 hypothetical protein [Elusimicrobiota bacterium]
MEPVKVYRNLNGADKFLGLELADGAILLLIFFFAFLLNRRGLFTNAVILFLAYWALRAVKRGKPQGYLLAAARYVLTSRCRPIDPFEKPEKNS